MATVYLHIGAPKTATSTLQNVLARNYARLLKAGVLYPKNLRNADAHHELACDLIEKHQGSPMSDVWYGGQPRGQAWKSLQNEIETSSGVIESVIISTELFFGQSRNLGPILEEISDYLQGHEVKVVVYLRRQDQLYSSFYNQDVKGMRQWPDSAYQFYETHQLLESDYCSLLGMWSKVFGNKHIIVRPFEPEQWLNGDIVQDFCGAIGTELLSSKYKDQNESLGLTQLYVKRCLNRIGFAKNLNDGVLRVLAKICPEEPAKGCLYVHRGLYRKYRKEWLQTNETLSAEYLEGRPLFNGLIPKPGELDLYKINHLRLAGYIKNMVNIFRSGKFPEYRALFAKATLLILAERDMWYVLDAESRVELLKWV